MAQNRDARFVHFAGNLIILSPPSAAQVLDFFYFK